MQKSRNFGPQTKYNNAQHIKEPGKEKEKLYDIPS
jgi:hypothetical protein